MSRVLVLVALLFAPGIASALDGIFIERGEGNYVDQVRAGGLWKWDRTWAYGANWVITGAWEAAAGRVARGKTRRQ